MAQQILLWVTEHARAHAEQVEPAARELGIRVRLCKVDDLEATLRQSRFHMVGLELPDRSETNLAVLKDVRERLPDAVIFVISADANVATMRTAMQAGASDFLGLPLNPLDLSRVLIRASQESAAKASARTLVGEVVTVYGCRGGLGCTTLAVNLAVRLREQVPGEVALLDFDLQRGDVSAFLNLSPAQSIAALIDARDVDEIFLHSAMSKHQSNVFVLAAPDTLEEAEGVGHTEGELAFRLLRSQYHYTVVDTARAITPATAAAFEQSDLILLVTDLTVPGVRAALRTTEILQKLEIPMQAVQLVIAQSVPAAVDLGDAARTIGKEPYALLPSDPAAAGQAMNAGTPLVGRPGPLADAIAALAAKITGGDASPIPRRSGLLRRIFQREVRA
jgi:pilus assembly protein CpaE